MEKMLLKSTTRHVRIFTADIINEELQFNPNKLTIDLDPDNEFLWNDESLNKVNNKFSNLVKEREGKDLDDYELRKIGSEIEGLIKQLLQSGLLSYNPECRVMNYSMGLPKTKELLWADFQIVGQGEIQGADMVLEVKTIFYNMNKTAKE